MGHYAKVVDGFVVEVIVAKKDFIDTLQDKDLWIKTSYNTYGGKHYNPVTKKIDDKEPLRKNYAGIGYTYNKELDAFIPPQPFPSWVLDEDTCLWDAPIPYPDDGKEYIWNESKKEWTYIGYYTNEQGELVKEQ